MATNMVDTEFPEVTDQQMEAAKKSARWTARFFTFLYVVLFPFFFYMAMLSPMVFNCSIPAVGIFNIFFTFLIPLSMPVSVYLMWSRYSQGLYKKTHFFSALPVLVFIAWFILAGALDKLARYFA